jgi:hypothetical protein
MVVVVVAERDRVEAKKEWMLWTEGEGMKLCSILSVTNLGGGNTYSFTWGSPIAERP